MPTRYIRSQILESRRYHSVGPLERLAFLELLLLADDFGVVPLHQVFLTRRTTAFSGLSEEAMEAKIELLDKADLVRTYVTGGAALAWIPRNGFIRRAKKCQHPLPDFEAPQNRDRFKELKRLCGICTTDAMQMHGTRIADARHPYPTPTPTPTSTPTAPSQANTDVAVSASSEVWDFGVGLLTSRGDRPLENDAARKLIGSWLKTWSDEVVLDACRSSAGAKDPVSYASAILRKKTKKGEGDDHWD